MSLMYCKYILVCNRSTSSNDDRFQPSGSVTRLAWRPYKIGGRADGSDEEQSKELLLAVASDDSSLRIFSAS